LVHLLTTNDIRLGGWHRLRDRNGLGRRRGFLFSLLTVDLLWLGHGLGSFSFDRTLEVVSRAIFIRKELARMIFVENLWWPRFDDLCCH
jgi:hypothetical protein